MIVIRTRCTPVLVWGLRVRVCDGALFLCFVSAFHIEIDYTMITIFSTKTPTQHRALCITTTNYV